MNGQLKLVMDAIEIDTEADRREVNPGVVIAERLRAVADYAEHAVYVMPWSDEWTDETHTVRDDERAFVVTFTLTHESEES